MNRSGSLAGLAMACLIGVGVSGCSLFSHHAAEPVPKTVPSASPSVSASAGATARSSVSAVADPVPPSVPGYTLGPPEAAVVRRFRAVTAQAPGVFSGLTVKTLAKGGTQSGFVVLLGLHPELVGNTTVESSLVPGLLKGMAGDGAKTSTQKIGAVEAATASTTTSSVLGWYRAGTVVLVLSNSTDPTSTLTFAKAYLAAE